MKEVMLEVVDWKAGIIAEASASFITTFARKSGAFEINSLAGGIIGLVRRIKDQKPTYAVFDSEGIQIAFSGFWEPVPQSLGQGVLFVNREPRIKIVNRMPKERTQVSEVTESVLEGIQDHFGVAIESPPPTIVFGKGNFAESVKIFDAKLLH